mgnify:CR=1 FL=1|tara:strand:+ start:108 stop:371 length:264 start_codon:yes stop_codon:yes gene_type:complete
MVKEIKYLVFIIIIILFIFFTGKYYFSDSHKKKSYRSQLNIDKKINLYIKNLPVLTSDTKNIIEYIKDDKTKKKKKFFFWELINRND